MFCVKCGYKLNEGDIYCAKCGTKIHYAIEEDSAPQRVFAKPEKINVFKFGSCSIGFNYAQSQEIFIRSIFEKNAESSRDYLFCFAMHELDTLEQLYNVYYNVFRHILGYNLSTAVSFLKMLNISDYDEEEIYDMHRKYYDSENDIHAYYDCLKIVDAKVTEFNSTLIREYPDFEWDIESFACSIDYEYDAFIENPKYRQGIGSNIESMEAGAIKAGIYIKGPFIFSNKFENRLIYDSRKPAIIELKEECFKNQMTQIALSDILYKTVRSIGNVVYDILVDEGLVEKNHWTSEESTIQMLEDIQDSYYNDIISRELYRKKLCRIIEGNPFVQNAYFPLYLNLLDEMYEFHHLCSFIGFEIMARNYITGILDSYSYLYYMLCVKDEESMLPSLEAGFGVIERILDENMKVDKEDLKEDDPTYLCYPLLLEAKKSLLSVMSANKDYSPMATNEDLKLLFDKNMLQAVFELTVYDNFPTNAAINTILSCLKEIFPEQSEILDEIKEYMLDGNHMLEELLSKVPAERKLFRVLKLLDPFYS